ncbi:MAG: hypothetical protein M3542_01770 [Acidobacteriota bacterium]|nr:hypothetical protein [Acidobacteriota bacterium]MDQ5872281.1 hypothetical protein [Acidobacteriota bacterium]
MNPPATAEQVPSEPDGLRVRWRGLALTFDEATLNRLVGRFADRIPDLQNLEVHVHSGELAATLVVHRFGVPLSAKATLSQLRLKDGFLAFVLDKVQALSFIPIPDQLISYLVQKAPPGLLTYYGDDRIMVVNLSQWMPPGIDLSLEKTVFAEGALTLQFGDGSYDLEDLLSED